MICEISSTLESFKVLTFKSGLNILVAERHQTSSSKDTRNGTGKTSLIELIHFLVAEKRNSEDDFHKPELVGSTFSAQFVDGDREMNISKTSSTVQDALKLDGRDVSPIDLRALLALRWFGLSSEVTADKYSPKFGSLLAYFVRKQRNGGFSKSVLNASQQKAWDSQVSLSYLLGFDWRLPQRLQIKKDRKKEADTLAKMIKSGYLSDGELDVNKLQARLDYLDGEVAQKRDEVASATVVDGYRQHEVSANDLTATIRDLNEGNLKDLSLVEDIDLALAEIEDANVADVEALYNEVGVFFSDQVQKRFEQVKAFHKRVAANRETHLRTEKRNAEGRLARRKAEIQRLQIALSEKLQLLRSGIAIERWTLLQNELTQLVGEQADLRQQLPKLRNIAEDQKQLKREIDDLVDLIGQDILEREVPRKQAVNLFAEISQFLYDQPGQLVLGRSSGVAGLSVQTDIVAKKSGGKNHMQIFSFDWLLAEISQSNARCPGFLVHDSHIFDGVDGRQIGLALKLAQTKCDELGIQYIVAMNSDDLQKVKYEEEASGEMIFDPEPYIMETRLSDLPDGGLFGIRF